MATAVLPAGMKKILVHNEEDGIAYVTINRPEALNSLTRPMMVDLATAIRNLDSDNSVKVIILCGSGRAFCSGVDLTAAEEVFKGDVKDFQVDPIAQMERCRKPIIGAVAGFAVTAGFELALACDILIAAKETKFIDTHARFGIFPSWGLSQKLSRIVGANKAREVSLTAKPLTAEQADGLGLVNHVVDGSELMKKARDVANDIMRNDHDLVLRYKAIINDGLMLNFADALALEKLWCRFRCCCGDAFGGVAFGIAAVESFGEGPCLLQWYEGRAISENARVYSRSEVEVVISP